jgi:hypothetical protein
MCHQPGPGCSSFLHTPCLQMHLFTGHNTAPLAQKIPCGTKLGVWQVWYDAGSQGIRHLIKPQGWMLAVSYKQCCMKCMQHQGCRMQWDQCARVYAHTWAQERTPRFRPDIKHLQLMCCMPCQLHIVSADHTWPTDTVDVSGSLSNLPPRFRPYTRTQHGRVTLKLAQRAAIQGPQQLEANGCSIPTAPLLH